MMDQNSTVKGEEHILKYKFNWIIIMFYDYMK